MRSHLKVPFILLLSTVIGLILIYFGQGFLGWSIGFIAIIYCMIWIPKKH